jgi:methyl-accepting chemotaxis protein
VDTLLVVFVGLVSLAFLIQSIAMWRAFRAVRETAERLNAQSESIHREVQEIASRVRTTAEGLQPLGQMAEDISSSLRDLTLIVSNRAADLDSFLGEMTRVGREQASKVDYIVTDTVKKFEDTTDIIKRDIIRPAIEISSFIKGIKSGIEYLFGRRRREMEETDEYSDGDEFQY